MRAIRGGHIPAAINVPFEQNWVDPDTRRKLRAGTVKDSAGMALKPRAELGFKNVRVYDSSWLGYSSWLSAPADDEVWTNFGSLPTTIKGLENASANSSAQRRKRADCKLAYTASPANGRSELLSAVAVYIALVTTVLLASWFPRSLLRPAVAPLVHAN